MVPWRYCEPGLPVPHNSLHRPSAETTTGFAQAMYSSILSCTGRPYFRVHSDIDGLAGDTIMSAAFT